MLSHIFHLRARTLLLPLILVAGLPVLSLLTFLNVLKTPYSHSTKAAEGTTASNPLTLSGEAALTHLKEQGLYSSLGQAVKEARYSAQPLPSSKAFQFVNAENGLRATFDPEDRSGTRVTASRNKRQRELAIKLTAYGYDQSLITLSSHTVNSQQNRVEYTHHPNSEVSNQQPAIKEWFVNDPDGIEHGFVLPAPPGVERSSDAQLRVVMEIRGDFSAHLSAGTQTIAMIDQTGAAELRYDKLRVYDANSRHLPTHFELDGNRLAIVMDDRSAQYPLTIDPLLSQSTKLTAGDGTAEDYFGTAVAISGNTAIVGAPRNDISADADQGAAYVFIRSSGVWTQQAKLKAPLGTVGDFFGGSVAISANTAIVGAYLDDSAANANQGAAYVFTRTGGVWTQQDKLQAGDGGANDFFGFSVAIDGDTAIIGAHLDDGANTNQGSVYVFTRSGETWSQLQKLTASDPAGGDLFGVSIALDAGTSVIGASGKTERGDERAGAAYVFTLSNGTWTEQQKLLPDISTFDNFFGSAVAVSGNTALIGTFGDDIGANVDQGAAVVFVRSGSTWTKQELLTAADGEAGDKFGLSVALSGDTAVIGTIGDDVDETDQGSAYVFSRTGVTWSQQPRLLDALGETDDKFGAPVAISGDTVIIGAAFDDIDSNTNQGSAFVFRISQGLAEQQKVSAEYGAEEDHFGYSVAISGDTAVVGAYYDEINGNEWQGAAHVFVKSGTTWTQQQKLTAADGGEFDLFGGAVAISGNTLVVGASWGGATNKQGAAYVFVRNGQTWTEQRKLTPAESDAGDEFGISVAISGDTIVVGAHRRGTVQNPYQGAAYVFTRAGGFWILQETLIANDFAQVNSFGCSVAISDDTAVVGAYEAAYVFVRSGASWPQQQKLTAADGNSFKLFGNSVAVSGDTALIGAYFDDIDGNGAQGSAYIFERSGTRWTQQQKLTASDGETWDQFGASVAISGDRAVVGAPEGGVGVFGYQGAAYLFERSDASWAEKQKLTASDGLGPADFGYSVSISGDTVVIGAHRNDVGENAYQGSAYFFAGAVCPTITFVQATLPNATAGNSYNLSVTAGGGSGVYNYSVSSGTLPAGMILDPTTGLLSGRPTVAGRYDFTISATDGSLCPGSHNYTFVVDCPVISVRPPNPNLPPVEVGASYNRGFTADGGLAPYSFSIGNGALPGGLALNATTGVLSGTPTTPGTFHFEVRANDSGGCSGSTGYVLTVNCATIRVNPTTPNLPAGTAGAPYTRPFTVTGGIAPYSFSITNGALPAGLTLDSASGVLSGTPSVTGVFNFAVRVSDGYGCVGSRAYVLTINCPAISVEPATANPPNGTVGTSYNQAFSATGGVGSYTFDVVGGALPNGLVLNVSTGVLSGTPASRDTFIFIVRATDSNGCTGRRQYRIIVN